MPTMEAIARHRARVDAVVRQVKEARAQGLPYRKVKRAPSHMVPDTHAKGTKKPAIDITRFNEILELDVAGRTCTAEPGVTFQELVRATLPLGLMPFTVPEHREITIGGAVSGCSLESMSYRHGGFHDQCLEYEVVTGGGEVVLLSREVRPELFEMVHGSYGTMAVLTQLKFRLHPAAPFVRMSYHRFDRFSDYWDFLLDRCRRGEDHFIDGIVHAPNCCVACIGNLAQSAPYTHRYDRTAVYYKSTLARTEDYLETEQYFFRYDADLHWLTRTVPFMEHWLPRLLLGRWVLGSSNVIRITRTFLPLFRLGRRRPDIVLDVFIPHLRFPEFFDWYRERIDHWPLWLVPYRAPAFYPWLADGHAQRMGEPFMIDAAIYGRRNNDPQVDLSEALERKTFELGGIKTLITRNHYDREDFWSIYSRPRYEAAKKQLDPDGLFGDLFDKLGHHGGRSVSS